MVTRRVWPIVLPLAVAGCTLDFNPAGTAVGNPTDMSVHLAEAKALDYSSASARIATLSAATCAGETTVATVGATADLLGGTALSVPAGEWCTFMLEFESPIVVTGADNRGAPFSLSLAVRAVDVHTITPVLTTEGPLVLELGAWGWLSDQDVDPSGPGGTVDDATRIRLETAIATTSALFADWDEDGAVSTAERTNGALAAGQARDEAEDEDD